MSLPNHPNSPQLLNFPLTAGFQEIQILAGHLVRVASLPWVHRYPFDRLLVAQAMDGRITLLTVDPTLAGYGRSVRVV